MDIYLVYLVNVQSMRKIFFSNFVCFSECPNFNVSSAAKYENLKENKNIADYAQFLQKLLESKVFQN